MLCEIPPLPKRSALANYDRAFDAWVGMMAHRWERVVQVSWRTAAYVGRYGAQSITEVAHWPISQVLRVARHLGEFLEEENRKSSEPRSLRGGQSP